MNHHKRIKTYSMLTIIVLLMIVVAASPGHAQTYPEQYLEEALHNNPGLLSQHKAYEASMEQADVVSALPDPQLNAGFNIPPMKRFMGDQLVSLELMQMFPWFGTLGAQRNAAEKMAESQYQQYRNQRNELFMQVTRMWLEIYQKREQLGIIQEYLDILQAREDLIYTRYESGRQTSGVALDVYRLEIKVAELENRSDKLNEEIDALVHNFNLVLGREKTAQVSTPEELSLPTAPSENTDSGVFTQNPMLARAQANLEATEIRERIASLDARPMLGLGLQYTWFAPGDAQMGQMDGGHMIMPMVSVSLPIYFRKNRAQQKQSQLLSEASRFNKDNQLNMIQIQWQELTSRVKNLQHDTRFYNRQLEITLKSEELVMSGYSAGSEGFNDLLEIQDQLLDIEWRLLNSRVMHQLSLAEMDMLLARRVFE